MVWMLLDYLEAEKRKVRQGLVLKGVCMLCAVRLEEQRMRDLS